MEKFKSQAQEAEKALKLVVQRYQQSDVGEVERENIKLKIRQVELESQLSRERQRVNEVTSEKERYRLAAHKLVSSFVATLIDERRQCSHTFQLRIVTSVKARSTREKETKR